MENTCALLRRSVIVYKTKRRVHPSCKPISCGALHQMAAKNNFPDIKKSRHKATLRGVGGVVLGVTVVLAGGVGEVGLALGLTSDSVVGETVKAVLALTANTLTKSVDTVGSTVGSHGGVTSGGLTESVVANREAAGDGTGANVDGARVGRVEVGLDGRVLGLGEVAAALLDELGLVLVGLVNNGLRYKC